jgi:hypothetical protein
MSNDGPIWASRGWPDVYLETNAGTSVEETACRIEDASRTEPAKLPVFLLSQESESLVVPMKSPGSAK